MNLEGKLRELKRLMERLRDEKLHKNDYQKALNLVREIDYLLASAVNPPAELKNEFLYRKGVLLLMFPHLEEEGVKTLKTIKEGELYYIDAVMVLTEYHLRKGDRKNFERYLEGFEKAFKKQFEEELKKVGDLLKVHNKMRFYQDKLEKFKEIFFRGTFLVIDKNGRFTPVGRKDLENYLKGDFVFVNPSKPYAVIGGRKKSFTANVALRRSALLLSLEPFNLLDFQKIRKLYEAEPSLLHRDLERIEQLWGVQIDRKTRKVKKLNATIIVPCLFELPELEERVNLCWF